eukprot:CFRG5449T1
MRYTYLLTAAYACNIAHALYEDQAGQFDWYKPLIGHANEACYSESTGNLILSTHSNVIASLTPSGDIAWRRVLEEADSIDTIACDDLRITSVSSHDGRQYVRTWSTADGELIWEAYAKANVSKGSTVSATFTSDGSLHVLMNEQITQYDMSGSIIATVKAPEKATNVFVAREDTVYVVETVDENVALHEVVFGDKPAVNRKTTLKSVTSGEIVGDKVYVTICGNRSLCAADLESGKVVIFDNLQLEGESILSMEGTDELILVRTETSSHALSLNMKDGSTNVRKKWASTGVSCTGTICALFSESNMLEYTAFDSKTEKVTVTELSDASVYGTVEKVFASPNGDVVVAVLTDSTLIVISEGELTSIREEALASTVQALMMDLPADRDQIELLTEEFTLDTSSNIFMAITHRLVAQAKQFKHFVHWCMNDRYALFSWLGLFSASETEAESMTMDRFGMHKVIVCMCANGKILGLHSKSGRIVYAVGLGNKGFVPYAENSLIISRSAAHFPHPAVVYAFGSMRGETRAVVWTFDPINGSYERVEDAPKQFSVVGSLPHYDNTFARPVVLLSKDMTVATLPNTDSTKSLVESQIPNLFVHAVDLENGNVKGYRIINLNGKLHGREAWTVNINVDTDKIVAISHKLQNEKMPLQFQIVDDAQDKLLYKYLNNNQLGLATLSKTGVLTIFLIDVVTGNVIQRFTHRDAAEPVHITQWGNNVVYIYTNVQEQRAEVVSIALYESSNPDTRQEFESSKPSLPIAIRQAMILPGTVDTLAVAQTAQGIASNTLLFGFRTGGLMHMSEKQLDPRRPVGKDAKPVVGLTPYAPLIAVQPFNMLNYYNSVYHFKSIISAPTLLESRAVIFAQGLDLYSCSITPAGSFDQLGEDFNRPFLLACVLGITLAAIVTEYFAREKVLRSRWK